MMKAGWLARPAGFFVPMNVNLIPFKYRVELALTALELDSVELTLANDSWFELHQISGSSSADTDGDFMPNNFSVQITDQSTGRVFSNALVPQRILCSPANFNYREKRPVQFAPNASLRFQFQDLTNDVNTVSITLDGYKLKDPKASPGSVIGLPGVPSSSLIPFTYISALTLAANQRNQTTLTIQTDAVFELHRRAGSSSLDLATDFMPANFQARMEFMDTGDAWENTLVPQRNFCAPANRNYLEARPTQISPGSNIKFDISNTQGSENVVTIGLQGYKLFGLVQ